ncbi:MAG: GIY-YIG nuclease family protein [Patescibacteria group bacterium]
MDNRYYVYILSNIFRTVLYIGVTNELGKRLNQHKAKTVWGFAEKYNAVDLIYYESFERIEQALKREKQLKGLEKAEENGSDQKRQSRLKDDRLLIKVLRQAQDDRRENGDESCAL